MYSRLQIRCTVFESMESYCCTFYAHSLFSFESSLVFDVSNCIVLPSWRNYFVDAFLFEKAVGHFECKYQGKRIVDQRHLTSEN